MTYPTLVPSVIALTLNSPARCRPYDPKLFHNLCPVASILCQQLRILHRIDPRPLMQSVYRVDDLPPASGISFTRYCFFADKIGLPSRHVPMKLIQRTSKTTTNFLILFSCRFKAAPVRSPLISSELPILVSSN